MLSSEERSLLEVCSQYNVDKTACKSYVQHLEFLDAQSRKRVRERNILPLISWTIEKDVKVLTKKQLKMSYSKAKRFKISGSKAELIDRGLPHARGNLSARDAVKDEESPNSCKDDTNSSDSDDSSDDSESSDSDSSLSDSSRCVKELFEVMFVHGGRAPSSELGLRESMGRYFFQGRGGRLALILSLCEEGD